MHLYKGHSSNYVLCYMSWGLGKRRSPVERGKQQTNKSFRTDFKFINTWKKTQEMISGPSKQFLFHQNEMC